MTQSFLLDFTDEKNLEKLSIFGKKNARTVAPKTMEFFGQSNGFILYKSRIMGPQNNVLQINTLQDRAHIWQDDKFIGIYYRNDQLNKWNMNVPKEGSWLYIFVENMGEFIRSFEFIQMKRRISYSSKDIIKWRHHNGIAKHPIIKPWQEYSRKSSNRSHHEYRVERHPQQHPIFWQKSIRLGLFLFRFRRCKENSFWKWIEKCDEQTCIL